MLFKSTIERMVCNLDKSGNFCNCIEIEVNCFQKMYTNQWSSLNHAYRELYYQFIFVFPLQEMLKVVAKLAEEGKVQWHYLWIIWDNNLPTFVLNSFV